MDTVCADTKLHNTRCVVGDILFVVEEIIESRFSLCNLGYTGRRQANNSRIADALNGRSEYLLPGTHFSGPVRLDSQLENPLGARPTQPATKLALTLTPYCEKATYCPVAHQLDLIGHAGCETGMSSGSQG